MPFPPRSQRAGRSSCSAKPCELGHWRPPASASPGLSNPGHCRQRGSPRSPESGRRGEWSTRKRRPGHRRPLLRESCLYYKLGLPPRLCAQQRVYRRAYSVTGKHHVRGGAPVKGMVLRLLDDERVRFVLIGGINTVVGYALFVAFELS